MKINYKVLIVAVHFMLLVYVVQFKAILLFSLFEMSFWLESLQYPDRSSCERDEAFWCFFSGFGSSIGLGVFVLITYVARYVAGPAVVLSALIATATAALSGKFYTSIEVTVHFQWRRLNVNKLNYPSDLT